ncbi:phosphate ABC transporter substrate-binding protein [bacterium]|nr:phosphate ABC transporter substrate-binding protein [bacterium]
MKKLSAITALSVVFAGSTFSTASSARDYIEVVGSSTVYPFATAVAEKFGKSTSFKTPKIESTGSGGGMKLFCKGVGVGTPDVTNASRRIKKNEYDMCQKNNVTDIVEVLIGYDGIAFANSKKSPQYALTRRDIYLALAKDVPNPDGSASFVPNPYKTWNDVNKELPKTKIEVLGPPPTSGTRDAFAELALEGGCKSFSWIAELKAEDKSLYKQRCHTVREDGAYIEAGENDNLIVSKLEANPDAFGVFGFSFLDQNSDRVQGSVVDGETPNFESISNGDYKVSRPLYFYVKKQHVGLVPGIEEYLRAFTQESAWGDEGYLAEKGMIPLNKKKRKAIGKAVKNLQRLEL